MNLYKFITPSDDITFKANSDKIAFACALILGGGKAGCENMTTKVDLPSLLIFAEKPHEIIKEILGCDITEFYENNKLEIADCFKTFAYTKAYDRKTYDDACEAIGDVEKLKEFKAQYEDSKRTSMTRWVKVAWDYADKITQAV